MPKIIPDIRKKLLDAAERILKADGYAAFSIRRLSAEAQVAVGTVYNYFHEKNEIVAYVILRNWSGTLSQMDDAAAAAGSFTSGMLAFYHALVQFIDQNRAVWQQFSGQGGSSSPISAHHQQLRGQIASRIETLSQNTQETKLSSCAPLLAELVLSAALQEDISPRQVRTLFQCISGEQQT